MDKLKKASKVVFPLNRRQRELVITTSLLVGDLTSIALAFWLAYQTRFYILSYPAQFDPKYYLKLALLVVPLIIVLFWASQLYSPRLLFGGMEEYAQAFAACTFGAVVLVLVDFLLVRGEGISRGWLILVWVLAVFLVEFFRFSFRHWVYYLRKHGHLLTQAVIVNADEEGKTLHKYLKSWRHSGLRVVGFIDDNLPTGEVVADDIPVIGPIQDLTNLISTREFEEVIVATGSLSREQLIDVFRSVSSQPKVKLRFSSGLFELISTGLYIKELASVPLVEVHKVRLIGLNMALKTLVDYCCAIAALILLSPIYAVIAILIKIDSPGPVLYRHRVLGLNGKPFDAIKFRTMQMNGDEILDEHPHLKKEFEEKYKLKDDPRVTKIGRKLRRTSLDELPQFINVLLGDMSIVGPRFISQDEMEKYGRWHINLLTVKPGITGLWQTSGRSDLSYEERIRMDMHYIRSWTLWLDIQIMLRTIPAVINRKGAY